MMNYVWIGLVSLFFSTIYLSFTVSDFKERISVIENNITELTISVTHLNVQAHSTTDNLTDISTQLVAISELVAQRVNND